MSADDEIAPSEVKQEGVSAMEDGQDVADGPTPEDDPTAYTTKEDTEEYKRSFALNYALRRKPRCLFAMAIGFPEFHGILDKPPLSTIKRKELNDQYIPKAEDFKMEIKRRSHFFMNSQDEATFYTDDLKRNHPLKTKRSSIVLPQPNQWLNTQLKSWLMERPMKPNDNDTKFIRFQVKRALDYLAAEGADSSPEVLRELPIVPTPVDTDPETAATSGDSASTTATTPAPVPPPVTAETLATPLSSSVTPSPDDIETEEFVYTSDADTVEYKLSAADTFLLKGGKPRILFVLALGMPEFQGMLEAATYNVVKRKEVTEDYMPRAEDYRFEIKRRAHYFMNVEDQINYYLQDLKTKNPLENLRGIVTLPQPAQWKLNALKSWLAERPLKPDPRDVAFLKGAITKCMDVLTDAVTKDPTLTQSAPAKRSSSLMMMGGNLPFMSPLGVGAPTASATLMEVISKQDAILGVVAKQTRQQTILNKITILTQSTMGYQQEISSLRSTLNDIENRILTVEMKIAENPSAEENLKMVMAKQEERVKGVKDQIKELEEKVAGLRGDIDAHNMELKEIDEEVIMPTPLKRVKMEEALEGENGGEEGEPNEGGGEDGEPNEGGGENESEAVATV
jgi:hypothetical protein